MNSKTIRRLAADHGALHNAPLPPNYLFDPQASEIDDLTELDILLAGPTHTPFSSGVWKLHLAIPPTYPQAPPTAHFRTPIFHPNVDAQTGGVCVETLKRDWDARLTLRDILVTISCLLIQPNPDSALNAEAGALIQEDFAAFARRAELMTGIHAVVPRALRGAVREAQLRGQEVDEESEREEEREEREVMEEPAAPRRRRRVTARQRGMVAGGRKTEGSPSAPKKRSQPALPNPFVLQTETEDPFGSDSLHQMREERSGHQEDEDSIMADADQENDETRSPVKTRPSSKVISPIRPNGAPVPLGELWLADTWTEQSDEDSSNSDSDELEREYPPSPHKSPIKSPSKQTHALENNTNADHAESSRAAAARNPNITPPTNQVFLPLAEDSPFALSVSPRKERKVRVLATTPPKTTRLRAGSRPFGAERRGGKFSPPPSPQLSSPENRRRKSELDAQMWKLCGGDIRRWNRGMFDGDVLKVKAKRW